MVLFVYDFFISESKSQVYGMLHRVFFKLRGTKELRYCLIIVFSMHIDSFSPIVHTCNRVRE